jgi:inorganic pyrophosphatase
MKKFSQHRAHPWHGISAGAEAPSKVTTYIEIVPTDTVKFEVDKESGILKVDRPQKYSSLCPSLYGFIPQTYCGDGVGALCANSLGLKKVLGDGDPIDICVLTERQIVHGDLLATAIPIGGFRLLDKDEADDKIIAVLEGDAVYGNLKSIKEVPSGQIDRLKHYFLTYKEIPNQTRAPKIQVTDVYDREIALQVITQSMKDYKKLVGRSSR